MKRRIGTGALARVDCVNMALPQYNYQGGYGQSNPYDNQNAPPAYGQQAQYGQQSYGQESYGQGYGEHFGSRSPYPPKLTAMQASRTTWKCNRLPAAPPRPTHSPALLPHATPMPSSTRAAPSAVRSTTSRRACKTCSASSAASFPATARATRRSTA